MRRPKLSIHLFGDGNKRFAHKDRVRAGGVWRDGLRERLVLMGIVLGIGRPDRAMAGAQDGRVQFGERSHKVV